MYKSIVYILFLGFTIFLQTNNAISQIDVRFDNLTRRDGLSHDNVYAIFQDRYGFMWFGTQDGLNRYDGFSFKQYFNDPTNLNSLISNNFGEILEDKQGYLWFGTHYGGLDRFDPLKNEFTHFVNSEDEPSSISSNNIRCLIEDEKGNLWIATSGGGINYLNVKTGEFERYLYNDKDTNTISSNDVDALVIDKDKNLWVGTNKSLDYFNLKTNKITHYILGFESYDQAREISIRSLLIDKNELLWIGTSDGLYTFDKDRKQLKQFKYDISNPYSISDEYVNKVFEDSNGDIWIGTENGLNFYDRKNKHFITYFYDILDKYSLSNNRVWTIFEDRSKILWIATKGGGVNKLDLKRKKFYSLRYGPNNNKSLSHPSVTALTGDSTGNIWIGTDGGGICIFNNKNFTLRCYQQKLNNSNTLSDDQIWSLCSGKDKIWLGMHTGGLNSLELVKNQFKINKYMRGMDSTEICNNQINAMMYDKDGFLWIGTRDGLNKMIDTCANKPPYFITYKKNFNSYNSISDNYITSIYQDHQGKIWIGTYSMGLNSLNIKTGQIKSFVNEINNIGTISSNCIHTIFEDHLGTLWIGTAGGGLNRLEKDGTSFKRYFMKDGLASNEVMAILEDYSGNLWISTSKGLSKFDAVNEKFTNFNVNDGLLSDGFNWRSAYQDENGWMYFGTNAGLVYFHPDEIKLNQIKPQIVITKFSLLKDNQWFTEDLFISEDNSKNNEFVLDYDKNIFSIEFAALDYTNPEENYFQYKIEGINNNWIDYGNKRTIMVTNLKPGKYILRIRGTNDDKILNEEGLAISILVRPPFWETRGFFFIISILALLIIISIYSFLVKLRTNKLLASKNHELEQANVKLLISEKNLKVLNDTKDKFFSIIAHDLRNPFNPLLSLTELLDDDYNEIDEKERRGYIKEIRHGAKRLYDLLENLLQWALTQTQQIKFKQISIDIDELIQSNIELLKINAEKKNISIIYPIYGVMFVNADENMLNSIIRNLLNNAIKFSDENSEIEVSLKDKDPFCQIEIKDQGIGISVENIDSIFKGFSKSNIDSAKSKGTGLGLVLCKEFVEKNGGEIWVESTLGKGSSFFFTLNKIDRA